MKLCQLWFMFEIVIIKCCGGNHVTSGSWQGQIAPIEPAFSQIKHNLWKTTSLKSSCLKVLKMTKSRQKLEGSFTGERHHHG